MEAQINFLRLLGDPTRLKLLKLLLREELCVCELVELLQITQPAISQHVAKMKLLGLVKERRVGQWTYYRADTARVEAALAEVVDCVHAEVSQLPAMAAEWQRRLSLRRAQTEPMEAGCSTCPEELLGLAGKPRLKEGRDKANV